MISLRLTQQDRQEKGFPVTLRLEEEGQAPIEARAIVGLDIDPQELEDLRWYLDDYCQSLILCNLFCAPQTYRPGLAVGIIR